jgi:hypothetical protein
VTEQFDVALGDSPVAAVFRQIAVDEEYLDELTVSSRGSARATRESYERR